jgi:hypothetical protein
MRIHFQNLIGRQNSICLEASGEGEGEGWVKGGVMTQSLHAHMNKGNKKKKLNYYSQCNFKK